MAPTKSALQRRKPKLSRFLRWMRGAGTAAILFGWSGTLLTDWFWTGVVIFYAGVSWLVLDLWRDPEWSLHNWLRIGITSLLGVIAIAFSWAIVFTPSPLSVVATITNASYPPDTKIADINFRPEFTELRVSVENSSNRNYEDLDLLIQPTTPIAKIAQNTKVPNVSFAKVHETPTTVLMDSKTNQTAAIPFVLLATDAGYKMRCPHLSAHEAIEIIIALASIHETHQNIAKLSDTPCPRNAVLHGQYTDHTSDWFGYPDAEIYGPRPTTRYLEIDGEYIAAHRKRHISQRIDIRIMP